MFNKTIHDFGKVKAVKQSCTFEYTGDKEILKVKGSCGCTDVKYEDNKVFASFTPDPVPPTLEQYRTNKTITVTYKDLTTDTLKLTALIIK